GFVHLGLRPGVIVPGRPTKILDYSDVTQAGVTPARKFYHAGYSAPELLREEPADVRSDIYSVGALLFHAADGKPIAESGVELMAWEPEAPVAGVPQILSRCLGDKDTRYSSAAELHRDLVRLMKRLTPPARYALGAATSIGLEPSRTTNQDAFTYCTGTLACEEETENWLMACVADGMGGMEAGDAASGAVIRSFAAKAQAGFSARLLHSPESQVSEVKKWVHEANDRVLASLEKRRAKGGSTVVCACLVGNRLAISHVGDCRLYLIRAGEPRLRSRSPVLLRISTPLAGERALCEVAKTATLAAHHSHSVDCKAERVRPGKCGNDTPIVSSASWCRLKTVTRYGRRTSPRRRGTSRLTAQTSGVRCCALKTNPACPVFVATLRGYAQASVQHLLLHR